MSGEHMTDRLLSRLEGVRKAAPGRWMARCPTHDDKHPSLSIREINDRLLIKCFTGCEALDVVQAVGLQLRDLFAGDKPVDHRLRGVNPRPLASDALSAVDHELHVAALICADVLAHKAIDENTWGRLAKSTYIIGNARADTCPARGAK